jgi:hypothetical protein
MIPARDLSGDSRRGFVSSLLPTHKDIINAELLAFIQA